MKKNHTNTELEQDPKKWIVVCGVKFRTLYQLWEELREEGNNITMRKLGEYLKAGMPHGMWMGQYVFDDETKAKIPMWISNRQSLKAQEETGRRAAFYGRNL